MNRLTIIVPMLVIAILGCSQSSNVTSPSSVQAASKRQIVGNSITSTLSGKRYAWVRARDQASGETQFDADGGMTWTRTDVVSSGKGRWSVDGERLCQEYDPTPKWKGGRVCRALYVEGATLVTSPNDGGLVRYTQIPAS